MDHPSILEDSDFVCGRGVANEWAVVVVETDGGNNLRPESLICADNDGGHEVGSSCIVVVTAALLPVTAIVVFSYAPRAVLRVSLISKYEKSFGGIR